MSAVLWIQPGTEVAVPLDDREISIICAALWLAKIDARGVVKERLEALISKLEGASPERRAMRGL